VIDFDGNGICFKVETHNHPSAVEPYGGAATGIGGVIRDPLAPDWGETYPEYGCVLLRTARPAL